MGKSRTFVSTRSTFFKIPSIIFVIIHDSGKTFIRYMYAQGQKIEKTNKLKTLGESKPKGLRYPEKNLFLPIINVQKLQLCVIPCECNNSLTYYINKHNWVSSKRNRKLKKPTYIPFSI